MKVNFPKVLDIKFGLRPEEVELIKELNKEVVCRLEPSGDNVGVYAMRNISRGSQVGLFGSPNKRWYNLSSLDFLRADVRELILERWSLADKGGIFQSPNDDARLSCFVKSSKKPNCDIITGKAKRGIKKGEEITI